MSDLPNFANVKNKEIAFFGTVKFSFQTRARQKWRTLQKLYFKIIYN